jgi:uncharacterized protein (TIGR03089 family)
MTTTPADILDRRLREAPADPLVTWYDDRTGERTELSAVTFANWVAKTANLLRDGIGLGSGDRVALALPAHWQAAPLAHAVWRLGALLVEPTGAADARAVDLLITASSAERSADHATSDHWTADEVLTLALRPLGLPGPAPTDGSWDYDREVRIHGDRFDGPAIAPGAAAWLGADGRMRTQADVVEHAAADVHGRRPLLVPHPHDAASLWTIGLTGALCPDGVVVAVGADEDRLLRIAQDERAERHGG